MIERLHRIVPIVTLALTVAACSKQPVKHEVPEHHVLLSEEPRGEAIFNEICRDCHRINQKGGVLGPDLSDVGGKREAAYLKRVIREPAKLFPGTPMPSYERLSVKQVDSLVEYLKNPK